MLKQTEAIFITVFHSENVTLLGNRCKSIKLWVVEMIDRRLTRILSSHFLRKAIQTLEITKMLNRDHRKVKKYLEDPDQWSRRSYQDKSRLITQREVSK